MGSAGEKKSVTNDLCISGHLLGVFALLGRHDGRVCGVGGDIYNDENADVLMEGVDVAHKDGEGMGFRLQFPGDNAAEGNDSSDVWRGPIDDSPTLTLLSHPNSYQYTDFNILSALSRYYDCKSGLKSHMLTEQLSSFSISSCDVTTADAALSSV